MEAVAQLEMFMVSTVDPPLRDNRDAMDFPFLSLQKKRTKPIEFSRSGVQISVAADVRASIATIWDWDLIIFAASHLNDAIEAGLKPSPRVRFVPHDALKQMGRGTGGKDYKELAQSIRRLRLTTVITNIREDDDAGEERPFSWLSSYAIPKRYSRTAMTPDNHDGTPDPARPWEIELPPWLFNSIMRRKEILAVHPDYFQLTGGLERWLYRLARKAVPDKAQVAAINFRMETLHERSGTTRALKKFAFDLRKIAEAEPLPEYSMSIRREGKHELVTLYRDCMKQPRMPRGLRKLLIVGKARKKAA
jgi:plasmid replication initiation protein